jgi:uncharacterized membrane protein
MFAFFTTLYASIFIAIGVAAVVGHVVLIDLLLRPPSIQMLQIPAVELGRTAQRPPSVRIVQAPAEFSHAVR